MAKYGQAGGRRAANTPKPPLAGPADPEKNAELVAVIDEISVREWMPAWDMIFNAIR